MKSFSHIEYISRDLNPLINCDIRLDITDMNFEDNFFNVIICIHVLEHIVDDRKALHELFKVLKPKGIAILQVPIFKKAKETFEDFSITTLEEIEKSLFILSLTRTLQGDREGELAILKGFKRYFKNYIWD